MDFDDTPDEATWRSRVRSYLTEHRSQLGDRVPDAATCPQPRLPRPASTTAA